MANRIINTSFIKIAQRVFDISRKDQIFFPFSFRIYCYFHSSDLKAGWNYLHFYSWSKITNRGPIPIFLIHRLIAQRHGISIPLVVYDSFSLVFRLWWFCFQTLSISTPYFAITYQKNVGLLKALPIWQSHYPKAGIVCWWVKPEMDQKMPRFRYQLVRVLAPQPLPHTSWQRL